MKTEVLESDVKLPHVPVGAVKIAQSVGRRGGRAFLVGGCVRDALLGLPTKDWDIEVHGLTLDELETALGELGRVNAVGKSFGVLKTKVSKTEFDVSIPRRDSNSGPGHRGILVQGDPFMGVEEACRRRDLTINALLFDPLREELLDPTGGRQDLRLGRLRAVDKDTFLEDPLRALRVVQFAARFGFQPDETLHQLCRNATIDELPPERILEEWAKLMLRGKDHAIGLNLARTTSILDRIFPELHDAPEVDAALSRFSNAPKPPSLSAGDSLAIFLAIWLSKTPPEGATAILDRLRLFRWNGSPCRESVIAILTHLPKQPATDADLRHLAVDVRLTLLFCAQSALRPHDVQPEAAAARAAILGVLEGPPEPFLKGRDLIKHGMSPGPAMGAILDELYTAQLNGELGDRAQALERLAHITAQSH